MACECIKCGGKRKIPCKQPRVRTPSNCKEDIKKTTNKEARKNPWLYKTDRFGNIISVRTVGIVETKKVITEQINIVNKQTGESSDVPPGDASYIVVSADDDLTNERVLTAGSGISLTDGGANGSLTIDATAKSFDDQATYVVVSATGSLDNERILTGGADISLTDNGAGGNITIDLDAHASNHQNGGSDEIDVSGLSGELADAQKTTVRTNTGANTGTRPRLNFINGTNISISAADDGAGDEVDITINNTQSAGAPTNASYVVISNNGSLSAERALSAGSGISITDNGANSTVEIAATGGGGDVSGPGSSTDNAIARFDGTGGKTIQNSACIIDDSNRLGINKTPASPLHIKTDGDTFGNGIRIEDDNTTSNYWDIIQNGTNATSLYFGYNSSTKAILNSSGELSLGNPTVSGSPTAPLYIAVGNVTTPSIEIDAAANSGDSAIKCSNHSNSYAIGLDNSDSDKFKISYASGTGAVLGTNDRIEIETDGDVVINNSLGIGTTPTTNLYIEEASGGTTPQIGITNSGGSDHDSAITFKTANEQYSVGVEEIGPGDQKFKISNASALGTSDAFTIAATNCTAENNLNVGGDLAVSGTKNFLIPHPNPKKTNKFYLRHSTIEAPTRGENLYRFSLSIKDISKEKTINLPDYYKFLNENSQVWISPYKHFGAGWGEVKNNKLHLHFNQTGQYNILLIGTRKDRSAVKGWDERGGTEPEKETFDKL